MSLLFYLAWFPIRLLTKLTDSAARKYHHSQTKKTNLPDGVRVYRSRWDHKGFGFYSGSNVAEPPTGGEGKSP